MATISQIRSGLKTRLLTIAAFDGRVYEKYPTDVSPPAAVVLLAPGTFLVYRTSSGSHDLQLVVRAFASRAEEAAGQDVLDTFIDPGDPSSPYAAVEADPTLGGTVHYAHVVGVSDYGTVTVGALEYLGCDFIVDVGMA